MEWQPIETAPKGTEGSYKRGPEILGAAVGTGWSMQDVIHWEWHKNGKSGAWRNSVRTWTPTHWMPLPEPPHV